MRHLSIPAVLVAGCLVSGAAWAQSSIGGGSVGGGSVGRSSIGSAPSGGSISSPNSPASSDTAPGVSNDSLSSQGLLGESGSLATRGIRGSSGSVAREGLQDLTGGADESPGNVDLGPARDILTLTPQVEPEAEGVTTETRSGERLVDPVTTGGVIRNPGEPSEVGTSAREKRLFREGEQIEQEIRQGICQGCDDD